MLESGVGSAMGYIKNSSASGTVPVYRSTCYSNTSGTCIGYGLSLDTNGSAVGYLSTSAPDTPSASVPFIQSNGLLLQGLTGTASGYLWSVTSSTVNVAQADHYYSNDISMPTGYAAEDTVGFLRQDSGSGAVALKRYLNSGTGRHYYSATADQPSGYSEEATLGYLDSSSGTGLTALYRHYNSSTGDYLLITSSTPPSGYALQATLGYLQSANSSSNNLVAYIRNPIGQVVQGKTQDVTYSYNYDSAHRVASVADSRGNKQLSYAFSNAGLLLTMQDNDGNRTDYDYDPTGRLTGIWAPNNDYTAFAYDDAGRLTEKWFPNGVNTQYNYNRDNTLKQVINRHGVGITISQHDYTYDGVGNRITHSELINGSTNPYTYAYDALNRLTTVTNTSTSAVESYAYDPLGNRSTKTAAGSTLAYVYDSANQLTEIRQTSISGTLLGGLVYDNNGNLTKKCESGTVTVSSSNCTGTTVTDLTHDTFNRLAQVAKTGISTQSYKYDDSGRRIQKVNGSTITNYLYNGSQIIDQYDNNWSLNFSYTFGPGADAPTIRASSTTTQYYHQNGIGNVVAVTNQTGVTDGTAAYDVYGNLTASTGTIPTYGFTGREPDETGFVFFRARYYDPTIGRFIQRDPIGLRGGINNYAYVGNNPTAYVDPLGAERIRIEITNFIRPAEVTVPFPRTRVQGDGRDFDPKSDDFRTRQIVVIETDPKIAGSDPIVTAWTVISPSYTIDDSGKSSFLGYSNPTTNFRGSFDSSGNAQVAIGLSASIPGGASGLPAPAIDNSFVLQAESGTGNFRLAGRIDGYPSTEIYATRENGGTMNVLQFHPDYGSSTSTYGLFDGLGDRDVYADCNGGRCNTSVYPSGGFPLPSSNTQNSSGFSPRGTGM